MEGAQKQQQQQQQQLGGPCFVRAGDCVSCGDSTGDCDLTGFSTERHRIPSNRRESSSSQRAIIRAMAAASSSCLFRDVYSSSLFSRIVGRKCKTTKGGPLCFLEPCRSVAAALLSAVATCWAQAGEHILVPAWLALANRVSLLLYMLLFFERITEIIFHTAACLLPAFVYVLLTLLVSLLSVPPEGSTSGTAASATAVALPQMLPQPQQRMMPFILTPSPSLGDPSSSTAVATAAATAAADLTFLSVVTGMSLFKQRRHHLFVTRRYNTLVGVPSNSNMMPLLPVLAADRRASSTTATGAAEFADLVQLSHYREGKYSSSNTHMISSSISLVPDDSKHMFSSTDRRYTSRMNIKDGWGGSKTLLGVNRISSIYARNRWLVNSSLSSSTHAVDEARDAKGVSVSMEEVVVNTVTSENRTEATAPQHNRPSEFLLLEHKHPTAAARSVGMPVSAAAVAASGKSKSATQAVIAGNKSTNTEDVARENTSQFLGAQGHRETQQQQHEDDAGEEGDSAEDAATADVPSDGETGEESEESGRETEGRGGTQMWLLALTVAYGYAVLSHVSQGLLLELPIYSFALYLCQLLRLQGLSFSAAPNSMSAVTEEHAARLREQFFSARADEETSVRESATSRTTGASRNASNMTTISNNSSTSSSTTSTSTTSTSSSTSSTSVCSMNSSHNERPVQQGTLPTKGLHSVGSLTASSSEVINSHGNNSKDVESNGMMTASYVEDVLPSEEPTDSNRRLFEDRHASVKAVKATDDGKRRRHSSQNYMPTKEVSEATFGKQVIGIMTEEDVQLVGDIERAPSPWTDGCPEEGKSQRVICRSASAPCLDRYCHHDSQKKHSGDVTEEDAGLEAAAAKTIITPAEGTAPVVVGADTRNATAADMTNAAASDRGTAAAADRRTGAGKTKSRRAEILRLDGNTKKNILLTSETSCGTTQWLLSERNELDDEREGIAGDKEGRRPASVLSIRPLMAGFTAAEAQRSHASLSEMKKEGMNKSQVVVGRTGRESEGEAAEEARQNVAGGAWILLADNMSTAAEEAQKEAADVAAALTGDISKPSAAVQVFTNRDDECVAAVKTAENAICEGSALIGATEQVAVAAVISGSNGVSEEQTKESQDIIHQATGVYGTPPDCFASRDSVAEKEDKKTFVRGGGCFHYNKDKMIAPRWNIQDSDTRESNSKDGVICRTAINRVGRRRSVSCPVIPGRRSSGNLCPLIVEDQKKRCSDSSAIDKKRDAVISGFTGYEEAPEAEYNITESVGWVADPSHGMQRGVIAQLLESFINLRWALVFTLQSILWRCSSCLTAVIASRYVQNAVLLFNCRQKLLQALHPFQLLSLSPVRFFPNTSQRLILTTCCFWLLRGLHRDILLYEQGITTPNSPEIIPTRISGEERGWARSSSSDGALSASSSLRIMNTHENKGSVDTSSSSGNRRNTTGDRFSPRRKGEVTREGRLTEPDIMSIHHRNDSMHGSASPVPVYTANERKILTSLTMHNREAILAEPSVSGMEKPPTLSVSALKGRQQEATRTLGRPATTRRRQKERRSLFTWLPYGDVLKSQFMLLYAFLIELFNWGNEYMQPLRRWTAWLAMLLLLLLLVSYSLLSLSSTVEILPWQLLHVLFVLRHTSLCTYAAHIGAKKQSSPHSHTDPEKRGERFSENIKKQQDVDKEERKKDKNKQQSLEVGERRAGSLFQHDLLCAIDSQSNGDDGVDEDKVS